MSAAGALVLALSALLVLGVLASWLLNMPPWLLGAMLVGGALVIRRVFRRLAARRSSEVDRERV